MMKGLSIAAALFVLISGGLAEAGQRSSPLKGTPPQGNAADMTGYSLIVLSGPDFLTVSGAKAYIETQGGTIAVFSSSRVMTGWIPPDRIGTISGSHGVVAVFASLVAADIVPPEDEIGRALVRVFNSRFSAPPYPLGPSLQPQGDPLINDALAHPVVDPDAVIANLGRMGMNWDDGLQRAAAFRGTNPGNSDALVGTIALGLMFVESNGTIDADRYTWTTAARDEVINNVLTGASWWSGQAATRGISASFYVYYYSPDTPAMGQGYEPITRSSESDALWINPVMANLGFSAGDKFARVTAFNSWLKNSKGANWAYTCFFCYNPPGAPSRFTDGYFAYAYFGGPYAQFLYQNDGWAVGDIWRIFAHETGHIFWACDEYYQAGYGGCTGCGACNSFRPVMNGNCEHASCNPDGAVPCLMRSNSDTLCPYTVAQIGWITTQPVSIAAGAGGTTRPPPAAYHFPTAAALTVRALPNAAYAFAGWTGSVSGSSNPLTIASVTSAMSLTANFGSAPWINLDASALHFGAAGAAVTPPQLVRIAVGGVGTLSWTATPSAPWITAAPGIGTAGGTVAIGVNPAGLSAGTHAGSVVFADPNASNSPQSVTVHLKVFAAGESQPPFGEFATPTNGATGVTGAIPVTGWALDDVQVAKVDVWRDPVPAAGETGSLYYVGSGFFVEGARPDVEAAYPDYPRNDRAGWGYMLLTNFLPNGGNGTYTLRVIATDEEGRAVTLGTKTITCDNTHAVKPFGTIDTPAQGGTASGSGYVNFGWVLTPLPDTVPKDGRTISVYVDSVLRGALSQNPSSYDNYRVDVSTNFPGLNNTGAPGGGGPVGAFFLDTTAFANGVHTIWWVAYDDNGDGDGIGSRYFTIANPGTSQEGAPSAPAVVLSKPSAASLSVLPLSHAPLRIKTGFDFNAEFTPRFPDKDGIVRIEIPEVNRVEIDLGDGDESSALAPGGSRFGGHMVVGDKLQPLPVGSTLDRRTGRFSWMPGPGFFGTYDLVFLRSEGHGNGQKTAVQLTIKPKI